MDAQKTKLAERVLKLFNLGDAGRNTSEEEAMAAVTKARAMMLEYNLTLADIEAVGSAKAKKVVFEITQKPAYTLKQRFAAYDDYIAATVEQVTDTENYVKTLWRGSSQRYWQRVFIGEVSDVAVATELFVILLQSMRDQARRHCGKGWSLKHTSYCLGYSIRLYERAKIDHVKALPEADQQSVALVLRNKETARKEWAQKNVRLVKGKARKVKFLHGEFVAGQQAANLTDLASPERGIK